MGSLKKEEDIEQIGEDSKEAIVYVNGVRRVLPNGLAHLTLLEYLRGKGIFGFVLFWLLIRFVRVLCWWFRVICSMNGFLCVIYEGSGTVCPPTVCLSAMF